MRNQQRTYESNKCNQHTSRTDKAGLDVFLHNIVLIARNCLLRNRIGEDESKHKQQDLNKLVANLSGFQG